IQDRISVNSQSTSLSVHIWRLMSGESPNLDASCAISIIILVVVLILNLLTKLISKKLVKYH
ncbi:MAG TPA: phosphate ABC transporter, permease protein PstA, partial [Bacilli bacterium]|nr:phosphate ABC transporter, permease protein PstA [Bacilli bacterium]